MRPLPFPFRIGEGKSRILHIESPGTGQEEEGLPDFGAWAMGEKRKRLILSEIYRFTRPCEDVFRLACPVKEDDWLPGWREKREIVYSESGIAELGCVFRTKNLPHLMGPATAVVNVYLPFEKLQYSVINGKIVYQIQWDFKTLEAGCEVLLTRTWTALTLEAEEFLEELARTGEKKAPPLFSLMEYYLTTGTMKKD